MDEISGLEDTGGRGFFEEKVLGWNAGNSLASVIYSYTRIWAKGWRILGRPRRLVQPGRIVLERCTTGDQKRQRTRSVELGNTNRERINAPTTMENGHPVKTEETRSLTPPRGDDRSARKADEKKATLPRQSLTRITWLDVRLIMHQVTRSHGRDQNSKKSGLSHRCIDEKEYRPKTDDGRRAPSPLKKTYEQEKETRHYAKPKPKCRGSKPRRGVAVQRDYCMIGCEAMTARKNASQKQTHVSLLFINTLYRDFPVYQCFSPGAPFNLTKGTTAQQALSNSGLGVCSVVGS
ncbi:hypothetical protein PAXINDRAFT_158113 [Paxillus involutus ATCC 200175]|uniref:Uncharacterized protein n=1 Tax=Paxillus involutus ATCC 200175 TaxID=664439 RepID=A0A0C9TBP6_PAXIN|nr:hypothetical protein PAXINDRAFT_158113 [Paxillus involutus ATCC 200175]